MRSRGEEPLRDERPPAYAEAAFLYKGLGHTPVVSLDRSLQGLGLTRARAFREDGPTPSGGGGTTRARCAVPGT